MGSAGVATAGDIAAEIERRLPGIGEVKLHKLLYYVQGYHLAWEQRPAFSEAIEAWENGPVVAQLWRDRKYGHRRDNEPDQQDEVRGPASSLPDSVRDITVNVLSRYKHLSGADLIGSTHTEDPWLLATRGGSHIASQVITHQSLINYFSNEPEWVRHMREHVATVRDDREFVADPPDALEAVMAKHFPE